MSSDKDNVKVEELKVEEESKNEDTRESKDELGDVLSDASGEKDKKKDPAKRDAGRKKTRMIKEEISEEDDNDSADDEEEEDRENDSSEQKVPLLDQPLQLSGTRDRKKVERFTGQFPTEPKEIALIEIPRGKGKQLGEIALIEAMIKRHRADKLKVLHRILFNRIGKPVLIKTNILKFNGFDFDKESDLFEKKQTFVGKLEFSALKDICTMLDLEKKGNRKQIAERIVQFLVQPADSGKPAPNPRPTRGSAIKANNKGFSESEEEVEKRPTRSRHGKAKRSNVKNEDTDGEAVDSKKTRNSTQRAEEEPAIEEEPEISEEESNEPKSKKKRGRQTSNAKKPTPKKTSAKKAPPKKSNKKSSTKKRKMENGSEEESSEDEPLVKKSKAPPTDDEIKTYVKEILEGANLEEITMKTVCKQVYAHYPEFDLAHKKDFIKTTVKSLIST